MLKVLYLIQACAAGYCSPAQEKALAIAQANCGSNLRCIAHAFYGGQIEVTESGVTIFRGQR